MGTAAGGLAPPVCRGARFLFQTNPPHLRSELLEVPRWRVATVAARSADTRERAQGRRTGPRNHAWQRSREPFVPVGLGPG